MLVLSRKCSESIVIDGEVSVMVVEIRGDKVRLGVTAPREVRVHRSEIEDDVAAEGRSIHVRFDFFVGLTDHTWIDSVEIGSGLTVKDAGRNAASRITKRLAHLPVAFIHFGEPEVIGHGMPSRMAMVTKV